MYDLVVIGSPSFDRVVRESVVSDNLILSGPSIITAVTAARLGIENMVIIGSIASADSLHFVSRLDELDIPEYFTIDSPETGGFEIEYNGGPEPSFTKVLGVPKSIGIRDIPDEFLSAQYIVLSALLQEIGVELVEWLCNSSDAIILMDPQLRTSDIGKTIGILQELDITSKTSCFLDFIKPNQQEAYFITGETDPFIAAEILVETLAENCIITQGAKGSIFFDGTEFKIVPSYKVVEIDSVGAGEAFFAGFAAGLLGHRNYDFCTALGASAVSFKILGTGTDFALDRVMVMNRANEISQTIQTH